ncbi:MAG: hypothetical protein O7C59_09485 [Rickettsia endosymbiont of Ixodes persulcatus]|nr:hypothetical protein [Rickettsia endosymbiont of Ixodes persulcatus]
MNVFDGILMCGVATGLMRVFLIVFIMVMLFFVEIFDYVCNLIVIGNFQLAFSELIVVLLGFVNAFVNGYVLDFLVCFLFVGLLSLNGFFDYFLVDVLNVIFMVLN